MNNILYYAKRCLIIFKASNVECIHGLQSLSFKIVCTNACKAFTAYATFDYIKFQLDASFFFCLSACFLLRIPFAHAHKSSSKYRCTESVARRENNHYIILIVLFILRSL